MQTYKNTPLLDILSEIQVLHRYGEEHGDRIKNIGCREPVKDFLFLPPHTSPQRST